MKTVKVILSLTLATLTGVVAMDAATAQRVRARNAAKAAAVTSTPEQTDARQEAHQENQETRKERREDANPNQKAAAYNVTKTRHQEKLTKQANAAAAVSKRK